MERFRFHAKKISGEYEDGEIEALDQNKALDQLESQGLTVISLTKSSVPPSESPGQKQPAAQPIDDQQPSARAQQVFSIRLLVHWIIVGLFILSVSFFVWIKLSASRPV
ncbi:MAG: hypothetical protein WC450_01805, partial [Candidatus Omnitrophota bacterium]